MKTHMITILLLGIAIVLAWAELIVPALLIGAVALVAEFTGWIRFFESLRRLVFSR